jgi:hypothetical protein
MSIDAFCLGCLGVFLCSFVALCASRGREVSYDEGRVAWIAVVSLFLTLMSLLGVAVSRCGT